jgi:hypothetical protein
MARQPSSSTPTTADTTVARGTGSSQAPPEERCGSTVHPTQRLACRRLTPLSRLDCKGGRSARSSRGPTPKSADCCTPTPMAHRVWTCRSTSAGARPSNRSSTKREHVWPSWRSPRREVRRQPGSRSSPTPAHAECQGPPRRRGRTPDECAHPRDKTVELLPRWGSAVTVRFSSRKTVPVLTTPPASPD